MIVKTIFLGDVSDVHRNFWLKLQKHGYCDVTLSASQGVCRHLYQLSVT